MGFISKLFAPKPAPTPPATAPSAAPPFRVDNPAVINKTTIKELFRAIRGGELNAVRELVGANRDFANVCATAPPKKDDGQSPLQVSLKSGRFAIADYLIEHGANVNFMEESKLNEWRTPVLHDAIRAAIFSAEIGEFDLALGVLRKLIARSADVNAIDSYGNNCLLRAILDTRQRIRPGYESQASGRLVSEIGEVFKALIHAGADVNARHPDRASAAEETRGTVLERFVL